jgi:hypothetical protein
VAFVDGLNRHSRNVIIRNSMLFPCGDGEIMRVSLRIPVEPGKKSFVMVMVGG